MKGSERLKIAAQKAAQLLDERALESLALTIEIHIEYKLANGESAYQAVVREYVNGGRNFHEVAPECKRNDPENLNQ